MMKTKINIQIFFAYSYENKPEDPPPQRIPQRRNTEEPEDQKGDETQNTGYALYT